MGLTQIAGRSRLLHAVALGMGNYSLAGWPRIGRRTRLRPPRGRDVARGRVIAKTAVRPAQRCNPLRRKKILEKILSPYAIRSSVQIGRAKRHSCIIEIRKTAYIVYR